MHGYQGMRIICSGKAWRTPGSSQRGVAPKWASRNARQWLRKGLADSGGQAHGKTGTGTTRTSRNAKHLLRGEACQAPADPQRGQTENYTDIKECETFVQRGGLPGPSEPTAGTDRHYTDIKECETFAQRGGLPGPSEPTARTDRHYTDIKECETFVWERLGGLQVAHGGAGAGTTRTSRN